MRKSRWSITLVMLGAGLIGCTKAPSGPGNGSPFPPFSMKGNEGGNGGDTLLGQDGSAWFLSPADRRERKYLSLCFEKGPNFEASDQVIRDAIATAIDSWEVYLDFKGIVLSDGDDRWRPTVAFMPSIVVNTFASEPSRIPNRCRGDEDLRLILGTSASPEVQAARRRFRNPIAFSYRETYDLADGWGKGFIWVAEEGRLGQRPEFPVWDETSLTAILTHELGHVLGCDHVSGTIMRPDILEFLKTGSGSSAVIPFKINRERELLLRPGPELRRPALSRNGESTVYKAFYDRFFGTTIAESAGDDLLFYGHLDAAKDSRAIEAFWGRPLQSGHVRVLEKVERREKEDQYEFVITLKDGEAARTYAVNTPLAPITTDSESKVFRMAIGQLATSYNGGSSEFYSGRLEAADGKEYSILLQRNSINPMAGLAIWFQDGKTYHPLYYPDPSEGLWTNLLE